MLVSNVGVVLVLSKKHMRNSTNLILLYMAIADLFVGIVPFPFTFYYYTMGGDRVPNRDGDGEARVPGHYKLQANEGIYWWTCYLYQYLMNALPPVCHNIAMWLTVLLASQR